MVSTNNSHTCLNRVENPLRITLLIQFSDPLKGIDCNDTSAVFGHFSTPTRRQILQPFDDHIAMARQRFAKTTQSFAAKGLYPSSKVIVSHNPFFKPLAILGDHFFAVAVATKLERITEY